MFQVAGGPTREWAGGKRCVMRFLGRVLGVGVLFASVAAQAAVSPQRIVRPIDPSQVSEIENRVPAEASRSVDLGLAPDELPMNDLSIQFTMTDAQQKALGQLVQDQQNPASPLYHQWITPEQAAEQFGMSVADMAKVTDWLTGQGFTVTEIARNRTFVKFSGTAGLVARAFHTNIHRVTLDGEQHITNLTIPQLPTAVASVTAHLVGLHDFRIKPKYLRKLVDNGTGVATGEVQPKYTSAATGNHFVAPGDFWTIYDVSPLHTSGITGSGVKIAIVGQTNVSTTDLATFRSLGGLPPMTLQQKNYSSSNPGTSTNDLGEAMLDLEWSGVAAPNAQIYYANSTDVLDDALLGVINDNAAPIISVSYGLCESSSSLTASVLNYFNNQFLIGNSQGQSIIIASGDSGATDCDYKTAVGTKGLDVDFPSDSPAVISVGGTQFNEGAGTYWGANNGAAATATGFIPSEVWNETATSGSQESGGGGASRFFTKPWWQTGTGVPQDNARDVPDVSLHAALLHDATLICTSDGTAAGNFCVDGWKNSSGSHDIVGGTSIGAPAFAGILALVVQKTGAPLGNPNPKVYALANSTYYSTSFHDVTVGDNKQPCSAGTTNCPAGGNIGYSATVGYDLASGWGSLDVNNFVTNWPLVTPLVSTIGSTISATAISASASKVTQGTSVTYSVTVKAFSGSGATPTGTVQFLLDNVAQGSPVTLASGAASYTLTTASIPSGAHTVRAAYSGDTTYAGSSAFTALEVVSSATADLSVVPASNTLSVTSGGTGSVGVTVNGLNSFTGTVTLSATSTASNSSVGLSATSISLTNTKTVGTTTLTFAAYKANATTGQSASVRPASKPWFAGSGVALAGLMMLVLPRKRKYLGALAVLFSVGLFGLTGCGSGGNSGSGGSGGGTGGGTTNTSAGNYTVTVTATGTSGSTTVTKTATITVTVN